MCCETLDVLIFMISQSGCWCCVPVVVVFVVVFVVV